jgi:type I restriction enzyme S subunit
MDENIQLSEGDILLMKDGAAMGKLAFIDHLPDAACLNSHLLVFRPLVTDSSKTYYPRFLFYFMLTNSFQNYVQVNGTGATFLGISQESIGNYKICLPPLEEQQEIAEFIDGEVATLNKALATVEDHIEFLSEYRTRLIADVVTGKLDVREAAANLPEETDEKESFDDALAEDEELENNEIENEQAGELEEEVLA